MERPRTHQNLHNGSIRMSKATGTGGCYLSLLAAANCEIVSGCLVEVLHYCKYLSLEGKGKSKEEVE